jgi:hypothetical protein
MRKSIFKPLSALALGTFCTLTVFAGNPQRSGSAGAPELLINPWARSSGWGSVNVAGVSGIEASFLNVAGTAFTEKTDIGFANTQYLLDAGITFNAFGFNQKVGSDGVLGLNVSAVDYGDINRTDEFNPNGGIGIVTPTTAVLGLSYAQKFTESIYGGVNVKLYNQSFASMSINALCFDAGVQYVTGSEKEIKFGVTLKNVGPASSYSGDGSDVGLVAPQGGFVRTFTERSAPTELPTQLSIGGSYDFLFAEQRLTLALAFNSNSFEKDQYVIGAEYSIREVVSVRGGYTLFDNRSDDRVTTVFNGLNMGLSVDVPLGETTFGLDYSYRPTTILGGVHSIGATIRL